MDKITIERDGNTELPEGETHIFLRYEIDIGSALNRGRDIPWKTLYPWIASLKPIAGNIEKPTKELFDNKTPDVTMWFLSRVPALPDDLYQVLKDSHMNIDIKIKRWGWGPTGLNNLTEEHISVLEHAFDSNLVAWAFLDDKEEEET